LFYVEFIFFKHVHPTELNTFNENSKRRLNNNISVQSYKQLKLSEVGQISKKLTQKEFDYENLKLIINTVSFYIFNLDFKKYV